MAVNRIVYNGNTYTGESKILAGNCFIENSLSTDELTVDTLSATIDGSEEVGTLFVPKGSSGLKTADNKLFYVMPIIRILVDDLSIFSYGAPVLYYRDSTLVGQFYMASSKRTGKYRFEISCISAIGILDNSTHYGGLYSNKPVNDLLSEIISNVVPYTVDPLIQKMLVYGWLPVGTRRENLHQLLFAQGISVRKNESGDLYFTRITNENPYVIPDSKMFMGGTVNYNSPASRAEITEHTYVSLESDNLVTLFEGEIIPESIVTPNGNIVNGSIILFNAPSHDLAATNAKILESGVNYAVLSQGSNATLTGKEYTHTTQMIARNVESKRRNIIELSDNTVYVKDATLVSLANSENVANRVMAYYSSSKSVDVDLIVDDERPGDAVSFMDPFGDTNVGFIKKMDMAMSKILKARSTLISGYIPTDPGNNYTRFVILTGADEWTAPEGVDRVRVVLIGGGVGGYGGASGEPGKNGDIKSFSYTTAYHKENGLKHESGFCGDGGEEGGGGHGGKIFQVTLDVTPGQVLRIQSGSGGPGGPGATSTNTHNQGTEGAETTLLGYSSNDGSYSASGYFNILSGEVYATTGGKGLRGGHGAGALEDKKEYLSGSVVVWDGVTYRHGASASSLEGGEKYEWYNGGSPYKDRLIAQSLGGDGGGPAAGSDGLVGGPASCTARAYHASAGIGYGGPGATATAVPPKPSTLGNGGDGGHGGGGGGAPGYCDARYMRADASTGSPGTYTVRKDSGSSSAGRGGPGGTGADGGAIIFF